MIDSLWDKPKKKYWELNKAQKDYIEAQSKRVKAYQDAIARNKRLEKLNREKVKAEKKAAGTYYHDRVATIHWVKDTPHSLAIQFTRWRARNEQR
jgi:hypothetical protein